MKPPAPQSPPLEAGLYGSPPGGARISNNVIATCIVKISSRYFLLTENDIGLAGTSIRPVVAIRLTDDQARKLLDSGIEHCDITNNVPTSKSGFTADFKGILSIEGQSFLVFDTTTGLSDQTHHIVLVSSPICPVIDETS